MLIVNFFFDLSLYLTQNAVCLNYKAKLRRDIFTNVGEPSRQVSYNFVQFYKTLGRAGTFMKLNEDPSGGGRGVQCGRTDMVELIHAFRNCFEKCV